jgi:hypothetical protein
MTLVVSDLVYDSLPKASTDILTDRRTALVSSQAATPFKARVRLYCARLSAVVENAITTLPPVARDKATFIACCRRPAGRPCDVRTLKNASSLFMTIKNHERPQTCMERAVSRKFVALVTRQLCLKQLRKPI